MIQFNPEQTKTLAAYFHLRNCKASHMDQCSWFYELGPDQDSKKKWTHEYWESIVPRLVSEVQEQASAIEVLLNLNLFKEKTNEVAI